MRTLRVLRAAAFTAVLAGAFAAAGPLAYAVSGSGSGGSGSGSNSGSGSTDERTRDGNSGSGSNSGSGGGGIPIPAAAVTVVAAAVVTGKVMTGSMIATAAADPIQVRVPEVMMKAVRAEVALRSPGMTAVTTAFGGISGILTIASNGPRRFQTPRAPLI